MSSSELLIPGAVAGIVLVLGALLLVRVGIYLRSRLSAPLQPE